MSDVRGAILIRLWLIEMASRWIQRRNEDEGSDDIVKRMPDRAIAKGGLSLHPP
jgi:hypothetical protein